MKNKFTLLFTSLFAVLALFAIYELDSALTFQVMTYLVLAFMMALIGALIFAYKKNEKQNLEINELSHKERLFSGAVQEANEGIFITDKSGCILFTNPAFCHITGYGVKELVGRKPSILKSGKHSDRYYAAIWQTLARYGMWHGEFWNKNKKGELYAALTTINAVTSKDGNEITNYIGIQTDISKLKETQKKIESLAFYDSLTNLPNRTLFMERAQLAAESAEHKNESISILFIDMDRFKEINDSLGHSAGDSLLIEAAKRLKESVRNMDTVSRLGGDEFAILMLHTDKQSVEQVANRIIQSFSLPCEVAGRQLRITVSIGVAIYPHDGVSAEELIKNADIALYDAKRQGRNSWAFYNKMISVMGIEKLDLETELESAIKNGDIRAYFQPKVRLKDGAIVGAEALARWTHGERGLIMPSEFIPLAEMTSLIVELGEAMLIQTCERLAEWRNAGIEDICVSVNLAARHFQQASLPTRLARLLDSYKIGSSSIEIEITESTLMETHSSAIDILNELRQIGVRISIDDFGSGYSSLSYLKRLPIDVIKIDQSFIWDIDVDRNDQMIVSAIVAMGQGLGLEVIAEGVETNEQKEALIASNCEFVQGYLYGKPMTADAFFELLIKNKEKLSLTTA